jgi:hypothetical protein
MNVKKSTKTRSKSSKMLIRRIWHRWEDNINNHTAISGYTDWCGIPQMFSAHETSRLEVKPV